MKPNEQQTQLGLKKKKSVLIKQIEISEIKTAMRRTVFVFLCFASLNVYLYMPLYFSPQRCFLLQDVFSSL